MEAASAGRTPILTREASATVSSETPAADLGQVEHPIDGNVSCGCCGRFPLVGEVVTRHISRRGREWACESCESDGRGARLGAITDSARVRSLGGASNVRRAA